MVKKNKDYEQVTESKVELPGGENVRLSLSKGMSLDFGQFKVDVSYSADFPTDQVEEKYELIRGWLDAKVKAEAKLYMQGKK